MKYPMICLYKGGMELYRLSPEAVLSEQMVQKYVEIHRTESAR